jgi:hypothetical protein
LEQIFGGRGSGGGGFQNGFNDFFERLMRGGVELGDAAANLTKPPQSPANRSATISTSRSPNRSLGGHTSSTSHRRPGGRRFPSKFLRAWSPAPKCGCVVRGTRHLREAPPGILFW